MLEKLTKHARLTLSDAGIEAQLLAAQEVLPEHLLLAFTREETERNLSAHYLPKPLAAVVLERLGISLALMRAELLQSLCPDGHNEGTQVSLSPAFNALIQAALQEAHELGGRYIGSEHLLLALLRNDASASAQTLTRFGVTWENAHNEIERMHEGG